MNCRRIGLFVGYNDGIDGLNVGVIAGDIEEVIVWDVGVMDGDSVGVFVDGYWR